VPANAYNTRNLGRLLGDMARAATDTARVHDLTQRAFAAFDRALALDRNNAYFYQDATTAALELGDLERARLYAQAAPTSIRTSARCVPSLGTSPARGAR